MDGRACARPSRLHQPRLHRVTFFVLGPCEPCCRIAKAIGLGFSFSRRRDEPRDSRVRALSVRGVTLPLRFFLLCRKNKWRYWRFVRRTALFWGASLFAAARLCTHFIAATLSFPVTVFIAWVDFNESMEYTATKGNRILRVRPVVVGDSESCREHLRTHSSTKSFIGWLILAVPAPFRS